MQETPAARRWRALIEEHAASGLTNELFARKKNVNPRTLAWWRSRLKNAAPRPQLAVPTVTFTEVGVAEPERTVVLALDDFGVHLVIDHDTDLALLRRVLEAVA